MNDLNQEGFLALAKAAEAAGAPANEGIVHVLKQMAEHQYIEHHVGLLWAWARKDAARAYSNSPNRDRAIAIVALDVFFGPYRYVKPFPAWSFMLAEPGASGMVQIVAASTAEIAQQVLAATWPSHTEVRVCKNVSYDRGRIDSASAEPAAQQYAAEIWRVAFATGRADWWEGDAARDYARSMLAKFGGNIPTEQEIQKICAPVVIPETFAPARRSQEDVEWLEAMAEELRLINPEFYRLRDAAKAGESKG